VFRVALSGGKTPQMLFKTLAQQRSKILPWEKTEIYWVDDRYVPHDHPESNYRIARELLLDHVPVLKENIHPIPTDSGVPARDAAAYDALLKAAIPSGQPHTFDLCLLGLGTDGHTASLFPGGPELDEKERWVSASRAPKGIADRITLTPPAICRSWLKMFLACGKDKAPVVRNVLGPISRPPLPAWTVWHSGSRGVFLVDKDAFSDTPHAS